MLLRQRLTLAGASAVLATGLLGLNASSVQAHTGNCQWKVVTPGAWVWAKNGHGHWYQHHQKEAAAKVLGPDQQGPDWVKVYMGVGGEGLMFRWDLKLKSGNCR